jgi:hypothetical protein
MKFWMKLKIRKYLGSFLVVVGLAYTYHSHITGCPRYVIFAGWALGPPIWFMLEYGLLFDAESEDLNSFRHYQSLCRNLWLGFLAYLAAFYLGHWKA